MKKEELKVFLMDRRIKGYSSVKKDVLEKTGERGKGKRSERRLRTKT